MRTSTPALLVRPDSATSWMVCARASPRMLPAAMRCASAMVNRFLEPVSQWKMQTLSEAPSVTAMMDSAAWPPLPTLPLRSAVFMSSG